MGYGGSRTSRSFDGRIGCRWTCIGPAWSSRESIRLALADQLRRSSKSICANMAEGFAKQGYSAAEYRRYLLAAIGSSDEVQLWLRYCIDLGYLEEELGRKWRDGYIEISRMLRGLHASWSGAS